MLTDGKINEYLKNKVCELRFEYKFLLVDNLNYKDYNLY